MRFGKIFLLYPCYAGQAHRRVRTSLVRRMTNLIAKELHSILNNNRSNPDHVNLKLYRLLLEEDLIKLMYKGLKSIPEQSAPLTNIRRHQKDMNTGNRNFAQNSSNFNQVGGASYLRSRQANARRLRWPSSEKKSF
jgi:hypothetical protein